MNAFLMNKVIRALLKDGAAKQQKNKSKTSPFFLCPSGGHSDHWQPTTSSKLLRTGPKPVLHVFIQVQDHPAKVLLSLLFQMVLANMPCGFSDLWRAAVKQKFLGNVREMLLSYVEIMFIKLVLVESWCLINCYLQGWGEIWVFPNHSLFCEIPVWIKQWLGQCLCLHLFSPSWYWYFWYVKPRKMQKGTNRTDARCWRSRGCRPGIVLGRHFDCVRM